MTAPGDAFPTGAMQYVVDKLHATGDPLDAERARLIGFMLISRGEDFPFPGAEEMAAFGSAVASPVTEVSAIEAQADTASCSAIQILETADQSADSQDVTALFGSSAQIYDHMRDGLLVRFHSTDELGMFPDCSLTPEEEAAESLQRQRVAAETGAFQFVNDVVGRLIPKEALITSEEGDWLRTITVPDLERMKRVLTSLIWDISHYSGGYLLVGAKEVGSRPRYRNALLMNILTHDMRICDVHGDDLEEFLALPGKLETMKITQDEVQKAMTNEQNLSIDYFSSPRLVRVKNIDYSMWTLGLDKKKTDLHMGMRIRQGSEEVLIANRTLAAKRLPEGMIEGFEVPRYLADLVRTLRGSAETSQ